MKKSELRKLIREILQEQNSNIPECASNTDFIFHQAVGLDGSPNIDSMTSACQQLNSIPDPTLVNDFTNSCCEELLTLDTTGDPEPAPKIGEFQDTADEWWNELMGSEKLDIYNRNQDSKKPKKSGR